MNTKFKDDEIENIINPKKIEKPKENVIDRYKDVLFYSYIKGLIKNYAIKHEDTISFGCCFCGYILSFI